MNRILKTTTRMTTNSFLEDPFRWSFGRHLQTTANDTSTTTTVCSSEFRVANTCVVSLSNANSTTTTTNTDGEMMNECVFCINDAFDSFVDAHRSIGFTCMDFRFGICPALINECTSPCGSCIDELTSYYDCLQYNISEGNCPSLDCSALDETTNNNNSNNYNPQEQSCQLAYDWAIGCIVAHNGDTIDGTADDDCNVDCMNTVYQQIFITSNAVDCEIFEAQICQGISTCHCSMCVDELLELYNCDSLCPSQSCSLTSSTTTAPGSAGLGDSNGTLAVPPASYPSPVDIVNINPCGDSQIRLSACVTTAPRCLDCIEPRYVAIFDAAPNNEVSCSEFERQFCPALAPGVCECDLCIDVITEFFDCIHSLQGESCNPIQCEDGTNTATNSTESTNVISQPAPLDIMKPPPSAPTSAPSSAPKNNVPVTVSEMTSSSSTMWGSTTRAIIVGSSLIIMATSFWDAPLWLCGKSITLWR